jgi:hypothetical protein
MLLVPVLSTCTRVQVILLSAEQEKDEKRCCGPLRKLETCDACDEKTKQLFLPALLSAQDSISLASEFLIVVILPDHQIIFYLNAVYKPVEGLNKSIPTSNDSRN